MQFISNKIGFQVLSTKRFKELNEESLTNSYSDTELTLRTLNFIPLIKNVDKIHYNQLVMAIKMSKSQLGQDIFALAQLNFKKNGFFVEFGATNGVDYSNTLVMEKLFNWKGILSEPAKTWHRNLTLNRDSFIDLNAVWKNSNSVLMFNETNSAEYSTIEDFSNVDMHSKIRSDGQIYKVNTISLVDLLLKYGAPSKIDYLSIDTEGSELDILESFDFGQYSFNVITVEHNYTDSRDRIFQLLKSNGYKRVHENISQFPYFFQEDVQQNIF